MMDAKENQKGLTVDYQIVLINPTYTTQDMYLKRLVLDAKWKYLGTIELCKN